MIIPAHLNFFSIEECGLYKHGDNTSKSLGPEETFDLIYEWVKGKPMEETIPWDPAGTRNGNSKFYCHDYFKCEESGDYLFVLWKSDTDSSGTILGAAASAETGHSKVVAHTENYNGGKVIWGRPCYYWIIPKLRSVVSIKIDHSVCDSGLFQDWVSKCITNKIKHQNKKKTETPCGQARFEFVASSESSSYKHSFRFNVHLRSISTGSAQLQELASRVTHIVLRDTIKLGEGFDERPSWVKLFDKIPHVSVKPKAKTRQIEVRAEAKPTVKEIKEIIEKFSREERRSRDWNNIGFETDKGTVWVDRYRLHETLNFNKEQSSVFTAADMYSRLNQHREKVLEKIEVQENTQKMRSASGGS